MFTEYQKAYHWVNVLAGLLSVMLFGVVVASNNSDQAVGAFCTVYAGWVLISSLLTESLRRWILQEIVGILATSAMLGLAGSVAAIFAFIFMVPLAVAAALFVIGPYLFFSSVVVLMKNQRGLV